MISTCKCCQQFVPMINEYISHLDWALVNFDFVEFSYSFGSRIRMDECDLRRATTLSVGAVVK